MKTRVITPLFLIFSFLGACAVPEVVSERKVTDSSLSCSVIASEISAMEEYKGEVYSEKLNSSAILFFPLALIGTYSNANKATVAADQRISHLYDLRTQKKCD